MDILLFLIIVLLLSLIGVCEYVAFLERAALVDRLMAKNLPEYKDTITPEPTALDTPNPDVLDLDEAKRELIYGPDED